MQNKGAITLLAILLALASIYQLSFTFITAGVKANAEEYAKGDYQKETAYLDSVGTKQVYPLLGFTFRECQKRELNLGLDLKGGMNVILEVSVVDLVKNMADHSQDSAFVQAIKLAKKRQADSQDDFITLFEQAFHEVSPGSKLASVFATLSLQDRIKVGTSDEEVIKVLREDAKDAIDNSLNVLRSRIDRFGVVQPTIQKLEGNSGRILIELPGIKNPARVRKLLQGTANLQFWRTYSYPKVYANFIKANDKYREISKAKVDSKIEKDTTATDTTKSNNLLDGIKNDSTKTKDNLLTFDKDSINTNLSEKKGFEEWAKKNPLFAVLRPNMSQDGRPRETAAVGYAHLKDTAKVNKILKDKRIRSLFPRELSFAWEVKAFDISGEPYFNLIALQSKKAGKPALEGDVVTNAREETDPTSGRWEVSMTMNADGAAEWARVTRENKGRQVAIVLDGYVYSAPNVNDEITGGRSSISGNFTQEEAKDLANILKSGKLQAPAIIIEEQVVGPSLGKEAIHSSFISFILAFILVLIYMVFFYKGAGWVANLALITNLFFIFGVLASMGAVLTLPGIAGIVLTIGMSVDANVLIYERIKEEMALGKGLKLAVSDGYKHAYSAIIDGNLTTLITGIILYIFGHGPIKGFATTLIIGILTSLFTAIFITRLIFAAQLKKDKNVSFYTKMTENAFKNTKINFIDKRKIYYAISSVIIIAGLVSLLTRGLNLGVDFQGGRNYVVSFDHKVNSADLAKSLAVTFKSAPEVKIYGNTKQVKITTNYLIKSQEANADSLVEIALFNGLKEHLPEGTTEDEFLANNRQSSQKVGPTIADDIKVAAIWSIIFALLAIFLYIFARFRNWQFGLGAIAALAHDVLIVLGIFSLFYSILPFSLEINQAFIAAILTVVGYSVNDTVVVFDRIREYLSFTKTKEKKVIYNDALNSTLSRTFNTSLSTFVVLLAIFIFGGDAIRGFVFAMLIGVVVGTYSSLFIATPLVFDTARKDDAVREQKVAVANNREYKGRKKNKEKK